MATIPKHIYRACEWQLHHRRKTEAAVRAAAEDAIDQVTPCGMASVAGGGSPGDRTGRAALLLSETGGSYCRQLCWLACMDRTREHFDGGPEGRMAALYYGTKRTMLEVADRMHYDRQTIYRYRDRYVTYLALLAAGKGLISLTERGNEP
ncbi:MAG: hypothetical protein GX540_04320 [Clostridiales bacterium]|nr:hypothetical protein [Clostridiales bacterium]